MPLLSDTTVIGCTLHRAFGRLIKGKVAWRALWAPSAAFLLLVVSQLPPPRHFSEEEVSPGWLSELPGRHASKLHAESVPAPALNGQKPSGRLQHARFGERPTQEASGSRHTNRTHDQHGSVSWCAARLQALTHDGTEQPPGTRYREHRRSTAMASKQAFLAAHPECSFLEACPRSLPEDPRVPKASVTSSGFIERYATGTPGYMHMPVLARFPDGTLLAVWQATPASVLSDSRLARFRLGLEGMDQQELRYSMSLGGSSPWTRSRRVPLQAHGALWSPVVHVDEDGTLWLFYTESGGCRRAEMCQVCEPGRRSGQCARSASRDAICGFDPPRWVPGGKVAAVTATLDLSDEALLVWGRSHTLLSLDAGGPVPKVICNPMVVLSTGVWALPYWREQPPIAVPDGACQVPHTADGQPIGSSGCSEQHVKYPPYSRSSGSGGGGGAATGNRCMGAGEEWHGLLVSADGGKSWQTRGRVRLPGSQLLEGSLLEMQDSSLQMVFRTNRGCLYASQSRDQGESWTPPQPTPLPNPNSKAAAIVLRPSGNLVLAYNNHRSSGAYRGLNSCRGCRTNLHLALSRDQGASWQHLLRVEDTLSNASIRIHYPHLLQVGDSAQLLLSYSRFFLGRKVGLTSADQGIVFASITLPAIALT